MTTFILIHVVFPKVYCMFLLLLLFLYCLLVHGSSKVNSQVNHMYDFRRLWVKCGTATCGMRKVKCGIECAARRLLLSYASRAM